MEWAWLAPALSAIAFVVVVSVGRYLPRRGSFISLLAIGAGFAIFWFVLVDFLSSGSKSFSIGWLEAEGGRSRLTWGIEIDSLSVIMLGLVTFVALAIQVYSLKYMWDETRGGHRYGWYFAAQSLFAASMLTLVLADNFLFLYIAWELVGLSSYLLIGFWYERRSAAEAAKKAFITTRIGDIGLLIGIILLFKTVGSFDISVVMAEAEKLMAGEPSMLSSGMVTASAILIFLGAMGKSAQFPLHVWLPDAMEGPTPVSALIHAATMVVAGIYLVARAFPLFEAAPSALLLVAVIGLTTALIGSTMALVATDLKRILAYSTITDLGFMMLALGAGGFTAAIFHMLAHGFSKALVFLGAGSVTHGTGGKTDIREMGGLRHRMPITALTFGVGALSLGGIFPFSGFFSKDEVLRSVLDGRHVIFYLLVLVVVLLKGAYMGRALFTVFFGPLKEGTEHAHESHWLILAPMVMLAFLALTVGLLVFGWGGGYEGLGSFLYIGEPEAFHLDGKFIGLAMLSLAISATGFFIAWLAYVRGVLSPQRVIGRFPLAHRVLVNKFYVDDVYQWAINHVVLAFSELIALFDRLVVNDTGVNGVGRSVVLSGLRLRYHVTGKVYSYALGMILGVIAVATVWLLS